MSAKEKQKMISELTAEIIDNEHTARNAIADIDAEIRKLKDNKKDIKEAYRLDIKELVYQKRFFYKLYKLEYSEVFKSLSPTTCKLLMFFMFNMNYKDNSIMLGDIFPNQSEISKYSGIGITKVKEGIKTLSDMNIIITEQHRQSYRIYLNPLFIEDSMTQKEVYYKFMDK